MLLGAGLDTRVFRLSLPADLDWYEVDRHEVLSAKDVVMAGVVASCQRHFVAGDLQGDWRSELLGAGFDHSAPTLWIAEGLFFYMAEEAVIEMLGGAARMCGPGSQLAADVVSATGLDSPVLRPYPASGSAGR